MDEPVNNHPDNERELDNDLPVDHSGTTVYVKGWIHAGGQRPPVILVHGLGDQSTSYYPAAQGFFAHGYSTYVFDLRGHGRSGRRLGHSPSFDVLVKDLLQVAAWVRHREDGKAPIIVGHGVGALIVMDFTKLYGAFCRAAVLSAPCMELISDVTLVARLIIKAMADVVPTWRIPLALMPRLARDQGRAPFPRLTAVFADELLHAIKRAEARFIEYHGSVLILCPERDQICSYLQLKKSAALHNEHNLEIVDLPGATHGVFTESDGARDAALAVILPWLERVLAAKAEVRVARPMRTPLPRPLTRELELEKPGATKA